MRVAKNNKQDVWRQSIVPNVALNVHPRLVMINVNHFFPVTGNLGATKDNDISYVNILTQRWQYVHKYVHRSACSFPNKKQRMQWYTCVQAIISTLFLMGRSCAYVVSSTLDIWRKTATYALSQKLHGSFYSVGHRGKNKSGNKLPDNKIIQVREHIEYFPRMESHYSRKDSRKQYVQYKSRLSS